MRTVTGAILLVAAEQAFAHACLIPFPNQEAAAQVLLPASLVTLVLGTAYLIWGTVTESGLGSSSQPHVGDGEKS